MNDKPPSYYTNVSPERIDVSPNKGVKPDGIPVPGKKQPAKDGESVLVEDAGMEDVK